MPMPPAIDIALADADTPPLPPPLLAAYDASRYFLRCAMLLPCHAAADYFADAALPCCHVLIRYADYVIMPMPLLPPSPPPPLLMPLPPFSLLPRLFSLAASFFADDAVDY